MAVQTDGFQGIIQGILQGHQIATQLRNQAMHEEAFQRQKESQDREAQLQDIETQIKMNRMGALPVENGMVSTGNGDASTIQRSMNEQAAADAQSPLDQLQGLPTQVSRIMPGTTYRKPIGGQTIQFKDRAGNKQAWELPSEAEQRQSAIDDKVKETTSLETARLNTAAENQRVQRKNELALTPGGGIKAPAGFESQGWFPGDLMTRGEYAKANAAADADDVIIPKEGTLFNRSKGKVVATGAPKDPKDLNPEELFLESYAHNLKNADGTPKTRAQMSLPEITTALGAYKTASADPEVRAATLQAKATSEASARLMEVLRQNQIDQAPTKEQAGLLADDLINHRLAPDQISQIRGRGNGALGLMIYSAAKKQDPNFSWEQASSEYTLAKSPAFQQNIRYMDSVSESIPLVIDRANKLANGGVKAITGLINAGKSQFNDIDLKKFQTDALLVSDEIAKILSGGGTGSATSDAKLKQAGEILGKNDSPAAIAAALGDVQQLIGFRRKALTRGTYLENAHGNAGGAPSATTYKQTASGPNGHKIGTNDNGATWFDIETGQKVQ